MAKHKDEPTTGIGYQVYVQEGGEEVGAVREVHPDHLLVYIENAGDFRIGPEGIRAVHDGKVILDFARIDDELRNAIVHAHDAEA
jgi:hypothetical protein